jgi:hypothetical protein
MALIRPVRPRRHTLSYLPGESEDDFDPFEQDRFMKMRHAGMGMGGPFPQQYRVYLIKLMVDLGYRGW